MQRLLVLGEQGFVGSALQARAGQLRTRHDIELVLPAQRYDLLEPDTLRAVLQAARPDALINLAAQASVADSLRDPAATYRANVIGMGHLLDALRDTGFGGRLLFVSSADVYGHVADADQPIRETAPLRPRNPYAVSKIAGEYACLAQHETGGLDVVIARPFNHIGPGQSDRFVVGSFAKQIARIRAGRAEPVITVGNIEVERDFTAVDDVLDAYAVLLARGVAGTVYNICSGRALKLATLLDTMAQRAGVNVEVRVDPARLRPGEQMKMVGACDRLAALGWAPVTPLATTIDAALEWWARHGDPVPS